MAKKAAAASAYSTVLNTKGPTPQTQAIPGREKEMSKNSAGGVTFVITPFQMLERFLILGSDKSTYYSTSQKLTKANAANVQACLKIDGVKTVDMIVEISESGRAPKNDPALFALAVASTPAYGSAETAAYALANLSKVARIGTHLFHFVEYVDGMRGWGRGLKNAIANWYLERSEDQLAFQVAKYGQRDGWSNKDLLALSHPKTADYRKSAILAWAEFGSTAALKEQSETWTRAPRADKYVMSDSEVEMRRGRYKNAFNILTGDTAPKLIAAYEAAKAATTSKQVIKAIIDGGLTHEMIPTQFKKDPEVWDALLQKMPIGAMVRNLGTMSKVGLLKPLSAASKFVVNRLTDPVLVKKSKIHPLQVLLAQGTYAQGHGNLSDSSWTVVAPVVDSLEQAFYLAFANAVPTGKNCSINLDTSGSMWWDSSKIKNTNITAAEMGAAMMLLICKTEKNYHNMAFGTTMRDIGVTASDTLKTAMAKAQKVGGGGTNCALAMSYAEKQKMDVDAFIVITDNETYAGHIQPSQALKQYRRVMDKPQAKLIVMGMTATECSIADPQDQNMFDVVGFDSNVPTLVTDFIRGKSLNDRNDVDE